MSSRFNAGELSPSSVDVAVEVGEVTIDEQFKNSQRFQLVRINDYGSEGGQAVLHETVRLNDVDTVATNAQQLGKSFDGTDRYLEPRTRLRNSRPARCRNLAITYANP